MSLSNKTSELDRLIKAFESEASKFHDLQFHTFFVSQHGANDDRQFIRPNHAIMLWQYYGNIRVDGGSDVLLDDLKSSDSQWGLRGSELSMFGVLEGEPTNLFVRMAQRAGNIFDSHEATQIRSKVAFEIVEHERTKNPSALPVAVTNDNPLAIWLNYLLYHLSLTFPGREQSRRIYPDPFSLSLLALERLIADRKIGKVDRSSSKLSDITFQVAMSFPGEVRLYVSQVVDELRTTLGGDAIFYDHDYQAQLARPNLDLLLQEIYKDKSKLIVIFLCSEYATKEWCGLEWRAIREIIKAKQDSRIMFVRFDDAMVDGVLSIDGYIDANRFTPSQVAEFVLERLAEFECE